MLFFVYGIEITSSSHRGLEVGLKNADLILAISQYTKNQTLKLNVCSAEGIRIFPCTYDESRFFYLSGKPAELLEKFSLQANDIVLLSVGRLCKTEKYKGHAMVMRAVKRLRNQNPRIFYIIVGDGDYRVELEQVAESLGVRDAVIFAGRVSDQTLADYYRLCDLFVMPSKGEGFGIVFSEAMACGKAVIAGNQDGSADALMGGELGALVNPDNENEISTAIEKILNKTYPLPILYNPELLSQKVREQFGFEMFKSRLNEHLKPWLEN